jgi:hypothetical protein
MVNHLQVGNRVLVDVWPGVTAPGTIIAVEFGNVEVQLDVGLIDRYWKTFLTPLPQPSIDDGWTLP